MRRILGSVAVMACAHSAAAAELSVMSVGAVMSPFVAKVRAKTKLGEGGYIAEKVARGEVEIVFHNLTEILPVEGVTLVGLLPAELQRPTVYSGAVMKDALAPVEAQALLDELASPEGRKAFLDRGFTAP
jgi:molybdate transport system substrate-binding protein